MAGWYPSQRTSSAEVFMSWPHDGYCCCRGIQGDVHLWGGVAALPSTVGLSMGYVPGHEWRPDSLVLHHQLAGRHPVPGWYSYHDHCTHTSQRHRQVQQNGWRGQTSIQAVSLCLWWEQLYPVFTNSPWVPGLTLCFCTSSYVIADCCRL